MDRVIEQLRAAVDAGHADSALVGVPVSVVRELLRVLPVATIVPCPRATGAAA